MQFGQPPPLLELEADELEALDELDEFALDELEVDELAPFDELEVDELAPLDELEVAPLDELEVDELAPLDELVPVDALLVDVIPLVDSPLLAEAWPPAPPLPGEPVEDEPPPPVELPPPHAAGSSEMTRKIREIIT